MPPAKRSRIVQTPTGWYRTYPVRTLRVNAKRKKRALSQAAIERHKRIVYFWGATARNKHETRSRALQIARRGPLSAKFESMCLIPNCQCTAILPLLSPSDIFKWINADALLSEIVPKLSLDDIPANHAARLERWSGKPVQITTK